MTLTARDGTTDGSPLREATADDLPQIVNYQSLPRGVVSTIGKWQEAVAQDLQRDPLTQSVTARSGLQIGDPSMIAPEKLRLSTPPDRAPLPPVDDTEKTWHPLEERIRAVVDELAADHEVASRQPQTDPYWMAHTGTLARSLVLLRRALDGTLTDVDLGYVTIPPQRTTTDDLTIQELVMRVRELEQIHATDTRKINELTELYKGIQQEAANLSHDKATADAVTKVYERENHGLRAALAYMQRVAIQNVNTAVDELRGRV